MVKDLKSNVFKESVLDKKGLVMVDMYANWCGPCKMLAPIVDMVSENEEDVDFYKVDVDENSDLAEEYKVMTIPTLLLFKDGELMDKSIGFITKEQVLEMIEKNR